jgi:hypothetical protein
MVSRDARSYRAMQLPDIPWDSFDGRARRSAFDALRFAYNVECGEVLDEKEVLRRYKADLLGLDWESAPVPRTSTRNKLLKGGALAGFSPLMFVSPGLTMNALGRIDKRLTNDDVPAMQTVADESRVIQRVKRAQTKAMEAATAAATEGDQLAELTPETRATGRGVEERSIARINADWH